MKCRATLTESGCKGRTHGTLLRTRPDSTCPPFSLASLPKFAHSQAFWTVLGQPTATHSTHSAQTRRTICCLLTRLGKPRDWPAREVTAGSHWTHDPNT